MSIKLKSCYTLDQQFYNICWRVQQLTANVDITDACISANNHCIVGMCSKNGFKKVWLIKSNTTSFVVLNTGEKPNQVQQHDSNTSFEIVDVESAAKTIVEYLS
jgi:hypothetical protein